MSGWIKFWKATPTDPHVLAAAEVLAKKYAKDLPLTESLPLYRNAVTGALVTLWCYADEHLDPRYNALPLTTQTLDSVVGIDGFFDLMPREWLDKLDDGRLVLPGYSEKNLLIAKKKRTIKSNARVTRYRAAQKRKCNGVTDAHVTRLHRAGDSDKDKDLDSKNKNPLNPPLTTQPPLKVSHGTPLDDDWWLDFKLTYPPRAGDPNWRGAYRAANARLREGYTPEQFVAGKDRYAAYCAACGNLGTPYVKQASTFFGPDKPFLAEWKPPASKAEARQSRNISASEAWLADQEAKDAQH